MGAGLMKTIKTSDAGIRYDGARSQAMNRIHTLSRALELIEMHLTGELNANTLAGRLGYSRSHLDRLFLDAIGDTPASLIRTQRLEQAAFELVATQRRIVDIALDYQFNSQEAFTRAFRRAFCRTPADYRRNACASPLRPKLSLRPHELLPSRMRVVFVWLPR